MVGASGVGRREKWGMGEKLGEDDQKESVGEKKKKEKKIKKEKHHEVESGGFWMWESTRDR